VNGQRIYIDSGGTPAQLPPNESGSRRMDLAILGMALPDSRARLAAALARLQAAICFTESSGRFLPAVERRISIWGRSPIFLLCNASLHSKNRSRLILLDYFGHGQLPAASKSQNPNTKSQAKDQILTLKWRIVQTA